jgi:hypothetical protein
MLKEAVSKARLAARIRVGDEMALEPKVGWDERQGIQVATPET